MTKSFMEFMSVIAMAAALFAPLKANAATLSLFTDDFSYASTGTSITNPSTIEWKSPFPAGYVAASKVYDANYSVKFGTSSLPGVLTTTNMMFQTGTVNIQVDAAGWTASERTFSVTIAGIQSSFTVTNVLTLPLQTVTASVPVQAGISNIVFQSAKRIILDNINITQTIPEGMVIPQPPVANAPTSTNMTSFTASWNAVPGATGYSLHVFRMEDAVEVPLAGSPFAIGSGATTSMNITGLAQSTLYRYRLYAIGDGTTTGNTWFSNNMDVRTAASETIPVFTLTPNPVQPVVVGGTVTFTLTATVADAPVAVSYVNGLPLGAQSSYSGGTFTWNTAPGEDGVFTLKFAYYNDQQREYPYTVQVTIEPPPLVAPSGLTATADSYNRFTASWDAVSGAAGYVANIWYGSSDTNSAGVDLETFWETELAGANIAPLDWTFTNLGSPYGDKSLKFDTTGDTIVSKRYPKAVTQLTFYLKGNSTKSTTNSIFTVFGSTDDTTWTEVASYGSLADGDGDDSNNILTSGVTKTINLAESAEYRRFKFVYNKADGNVAFDNLGAVYQGSGPVFLNGWRNATVSGTAIEVNALPSRIYWVQVGSTDGSKTLFTTTCLRLSDAPKSTLIVVK